MSQQIFLGIQAQWARMGKMLPGGKNWVIAAMTAH